MRYRVKEVNLSSRDNNILPQRENQNLSYALFNLNETENNFLDIEKPKYLIQNWEFEIRKLTYEDTGTYVCLLPLAKPITKNVTLQVIRKFKFFEFMLKRRGNLSK